MDTNAATALLAIDKLWAGQNSFEWIKVDRKQKAPPIHKFRSPLMHESTVMEAVFVDIKHKQSPIAGLPDTISFSFIAEDCRILGIDDGPKTSHINRVGVGLPYYQKMVSHPHLHTPVDDADLDGYATPIPPSSHQDLWRLFVQTAKIMGAPAYHQPALQTELDL